MCKTCVKKDKIIVAYNVLRLAETTLSNLGDEELENYDIANLIESLSKQIISIKNKK